MRVARTYRLDPELILRVEEEADRLGQSLTVFVSRALEAALSSARVSSVTREMYESEALMDQLRAPAADGSALARAVAVGAGNLRRAGSGHLATCKCAVCKPPK